MKVGLTTARFSTILSMRPSTAVGEADLRAGSASRTLPNTWDSGSQRYCRSSGPRMPERLDRRALVGPAVVRQPDALGPAGGARGVDQRGQVLRLDRGDPRRRPRPGRPRGARAPSAVQVGQRDHPVAVGRRRRTATTLRQRRAARSRCSRTLSTWAAFSANTTWSRSRPGCRRRRRPGGRVDRGGRAAGAHDRQVGAGSTRSGSLEAIATRCSGSTPSATRPAAEPAHPSAVSCQVSETQLAALGIAEGLPVGRLATRSKNIRATFGARSRTADSSWEAGSDVDIVILWLATVVRRGYCTALLHGRRRGRDPLAGCGGGRISPGGVASGAWTERERRSPMRCTIVPPYLVRSMADADQSAVADRARRALDLDQQFRARRPNTRETHSRAPEPAAEEERDERGAAAAPTNPRRRRRHPVARPDGPARGRAAHGRRRGRRGLRRARCHLALFRGLRPRLPRRPGHAAAAPRSTTARTTTTRSGTASRWCSATATADLQAASPARST